MARKAKPRSLDARIRRVLRYLDSETSAQWVGLYKQIAREQYGSVQACLVLDERDMAEDGAEV
jgi:hypothetical protein